MNRLSKLAALRPGDRQLLAMAGMTVLAVRVALWLIPYGRTREFLKRSSQKAKRTQEPRESPDRVAWAVRTSSKAVPKASCLTQALAAELLLARRGHDSELRIGVARGEGGRFEAHAWLEANGEIVIGALDDLERFTPLGPPHHLHASGVLKSLN